MTVFKNEVPSFQFSMKNTISLILFTAGFAVVFLNVYAPFGFKSQFWSGITDLQLLFYSTIATLTGMLVVVISRMIMFYYGRKYKIKYINYIAWIMLEIFSMAFFYTLLQTIVLHDERDFYVLLKLSIINTALVLLLPYSFSWLYFSWLDVNMKLAAYKNNHSLHHDETNTETTTINSLLSFNDVSGTMRISIKITDLLYLEAADNYVQICYTKGSKIAKSMIRNTLKNIEKELITYNILRCHRSFLINFNKIKIIEKGENGLQILLDHQEEIIIPVSKSYAKSVLNSFNNSHIQE